MEYLGFLTRISVCFVLGIIIGLERQYRRKIAGIRTITLVSLGAFLFVSISDFTNPNDITRIAAQVVSGIGFIGAGVILRDGKDIRGLNTAATLWCSAAIGTLTALNLIGEAVIGVLYILLSNILLRFVSRTIMKKINQKAEYYIMTIECELDKEMAVKNLLIQKLKSQKNILKTFSTKKGEKSVSIEAHLEILNDGIESVDSIINRLCIEPGIVSTQYNKVNNYVDDDDDDFEGK
ncbi:MAG: MgtC/SapB family protein [Bacilli bacterium]|nr:MgtC/SapB family protein [Bacilli bacterium]